MRMKKKIKKIKKGKKIKAKKNDTEFSKESKGMFLSITCLYF
jgi:hypothetical protein